MGTPTATPLFVDTGSPTSTPSGPIPTQSPTPTHTATPTEAPTPGPCGAPPGSGWDEGALEARFVDEIYPLLTRTVGGCAGCHYEGSGQAMTLGEDGPSTFQETWAAGYLARGADTFLDRLTRTGAGAMPLGGPSWTAAEIGLLSCLVDDLASLEDAPTPPQVGSCDDVLDPGWVGIHRLNQLEYNNTVRDLLGDGTRPADGFPADGRGYGFDNIADVLTTSPLLVDAWSGAARLLVDGTLGPLVLPAVTRYEAEALTATGGTASDLGYLFGSNGAALVPLDLAAAGRYELRARAFQEPAGDGDAQMTFTLDGALIATFTVSALVEAPAVYAVGVDLDEGPHELSVAFINDYFSLLRPPTGDRNLLVDWVEMEGPWGYVPPPSPRRDALMTCTPAPGQEAACARQILAPFVRRAWRRAVGEDEVGRLVTLATDALARGDDFETAIRWPLRAVLLSPSFLYRVEADPDPADPAPHPLSGMELASRLSYFLWSSTPDEELMAAAESGRLADPLVLDAQVERLLSDPRASSLADSFAGQWLFARAMTGVHPDPLVFPDFDPALPADFAQETLLSFGTALEEDRPVVDLLDPDFAWINDRLAAHYGLLAVGSDALTRVELPEDHQGGLLTGGTFLTVTSHPNLTSPVLRGKWVLSQLLCQPPSPPPPGVVAAEPDPEGGQSQREEYEQHQSDPYCASCHTTMDPIGFGLDNYDAVGQWREVDDYGYDIDASGVLPGDRAFDGPAELIDLLRTDPAVAWCAGRQLLTYATGRGLEADDDCAVDALDDASQMEGGGLRTLVHLVTESPLFQTRRAEGLEEEP